MKKLASIFMIFLPAVYTSGHSDQTISNLKTFAKVYGYVKYFHPGDEASEVDWEKFSAFGAKEVVNCNTNHQLISVLNTLFNPIAPSVIFKTTQAEPGYNLSLITPGDPSEYRITYWQHKGVGLGMNAGPYNSIRVNRKTTPEHDKLFDCQYDFGTVFSAVIGNGINCQVPLTLYCNDNYTYPQAEQALLYDLSDNLNMFDYEEEKLFLRLGNIINTYNVFRHFYPYFEEVDVDWDYEFNTALSRSFGDKTPEDHLITLQKFTASLRDGHINVYLEYQKNFIPPVTWEWIEDQLVITYLYEETPGIQVGDIVSLVNGITPEVYFKEVYSRISAGNKGWLDYRASYASLVGNKDSKLTLTINDRTINLYRGKEYYHRENNEPGYRMIGDSTWYINMARVGMDMINEILPRLATARAIICDSRGYPAGNHEFITHLMKNDDTASGWLQIPLIMYPNQKNVIYEKHDLVPVMKAREPYLGDKKIVYIIDGKAISYAETCLSYIEGYRLAQIIGQPSAGTNGNVNSFRLPGGYGVFWTGMKVVKHDGSRHHGIGIVPDILVSKTIKGVMEGRDEFLEKAIELSEQ